MHNTIEDLQIDMWYGDKFEPKKFGADAHFREHGCPERCYAGNIYSADGKMIGDYTATNSTIIEENFLIKWND